MTRSTWMATSANSYRLPGTFSTGWRNDGLVYHGGQSNLHKGLWFFNDSAIRNTLSGERILSVELRITRQNSVHGTTGLAYPTYRLHGYVTTPAGEPAVYEVLNGTTGFNRGDRKNQVLPIGWGEALRDGDYRGLALYTTNGGNYIIFQGNAELIIEHESINTAPLSPVLFQPTANSQHLTNEDLGFAWDFRDPDSGDYQSWYQLQVRREGSVVTDRVVSSTSESWTAPADTYTSGAHDFRVRTKDSSSATSPYSAWVPFTMLDPVLDAPALPNIITPTDGATISTTNLIVEWTSIVQAAAQVRRVGDNAGSPDTSVIYEDVTLGATIRSHYTEFAVNGRSEHIQVRVQDPDTLLWSAWRSHIIHISFTPPPTPTIIIIEPLPADAAIRVHWTIPDPVSGEPSVSQVRLRRRPVGDQGDGIQVGNPSFPEEGSATDWTPASEVEYAYQLAADGANGTTSRSEWTT